MSGRHKASSVFSAASNERVTTVAGVRSAQASERHRSARDGDAAALLLPAAPDAPGKYASSPPAMSWPSAGTTARDDCGDVGDGSAAPRGDAAGAVAVAGTRLLLMFAHGRPAAGAVSAEMPPMI